MTGLCCEDDGLLARREAETTGGHVLDLRWTVARKPTQSLLLIQRSTCQRTGVGHHALGFLNW